MSSKISVNVSRRCETCGKALPFNPLRSEEQGVSTAGAACCRYLPRIAPGCWLRGLVP